jgi:hypothetical protein
MKLLVLTLAAYAAFSPISAMAGEGRHPQWSLDLGRYRTSKLRLGTAPASYLESVVAVTNSYVAVGLDVEEPITGPPQESTKRQSKLSLLIFGADNGKLSAKCGPWTVDKWFDLMATPSGNFLLHLAPLSDANPHGAETLLLLSPACAQLKEAALPNLASSEYRAWRALQSPSRKTLLLRKQRKERMVFQLRDVDSLDLRFEWFESDPKAPMTISVSDKGFLGVPPGPTTAISEAGPLVDYYRTFEGAWQRLPYSNFYSFLSDDALVGTADSPAQPWKVSKTQVTVIRLDGIAVFSEMVSGVGYHVDRASDIAVSSDNDHFAFTLDFSGAGWLWGTLDMGPEHRSIYVWSASRAQPCAKIKLGSWTDQPSLALAPDGSWFALLTDNSSRLAVRDLPSPAPK